MRHGAQGDASALLQACLLVDSVDSLSLAHDLLEESLRIRPELREKAEDRLTADLEAPEAARRQLAAEVRLARRLRSLVTLDEKREIAKEWITGAEYMLFVHSGGHSHQPPHWGGDGCPPGQLLAPVVGLTAQAAVEFCNWLTLRDKEARHYRLPTAAEAQQMPAGEQVGLGSWCGQAEKAGLVGPAESELERLHTLVAALGSELPPPSLDFLRNVMAAPAAPVGVRKFLDAPDLYFGSSLGLGRNPYLYVYVDLQRDRHDDLSHDLGLAIALASAVPEPELAALLNQCMILRAARRNETPGAPLTRERSQDYALGASCCNH